MASQPNSTDGATPSKEEAARAVAEVGGVRSSDDPAPDLWFGELTGERRDATSSAAVKRSKGCGDGPQGYEPAEGQALRDRVRAMTCRGTTWRDPAAVVREINLTTRGWGNYFAQHHYRQGFRQMNHYLGHRLRPWLWRKHGNPWGKYERWTDHILHTTYKLYVLPN